MFDPRALLRRVRASQPLNMVATSMTHAALHAEQGEAREISTRWMFREFRLGRHLTPRS